jgi:hypothetical protein
MPAGRTTAAYNPADYDEFGNYIGGAPAPAPPPPDGTLPMADQSMYAAPIEAKYQQAPAPPPPTDAYNSTPSNPSTALTVQSYYPSAAGTPNGAPTQNTYQSLDHMRGAVPYSPPYNFAAAEPNVMSPYAVERTRGDTMWELGTQENYTPPPRVTIDPAPTPPPFFMGGGGDGVLSTSVDRNKAGLDKPFAPPVLNTYDKQDSVIGGWRGGRYISPAETQSALDQIAATGQPAGNSTGPLETIGNALGSGAAALGALGTGIADFFMPPPAGAAGLNEQYRQETAARQKPLQAPDPTLAATPPSELYGGPSGVPDDPNRRNRIDRLYPSGEFSPSSVTYGAPAVAQQEPAPSGGSGGGFGNPFDIFKGLQNNNGAAASTAQPTPGNPLDLLKDLQNNRGAPAGELYGGPSGVADDPARKYRIDRMSPSGEFPDSSVTYTPEGVSLPKRTAPTAQETKTAASGNRATGLRAEAFGQPMGAFMTPEMRALHQDLYRKGAIKPDGTFTDAQMADAQKRGYVDANGNWTAAAANDPNNPLPIDPAMVGTTARWHDLLAAKKTPSGVTESTASETPATPSPAAAANSGTSSNSGNNAGSSSNSGGGGYRNYSNSGGSSGRSYGSRSGRSFGSDDDGEPSSRWQDYAEDEDGDGQFSAAEIKRAKFRMKQAQKRRGKKGRFGKGKTNVPSFPDSPQRQLVLSNLSGAFDEAFANFPKPR